MNEVLTTRFGGRRTIIFAAAVLIVVLVIVGAQTWERSAEATPAERFAEAIFELEQADNQTPAATVGDQAIPVGKVKAYLVLANASPAFREADFAKSDPGVYLEQLIENQLLFQEAERRGLLPTDQEVMKLATQTKLGLQSFMREDTALAADLRSVFGQVEGTEYHVDVYDSSPTMLDGFRQQIAIGKLRDQLLAQLSAEDRNDPTKREALIKEFAAEARTKTNVKVLIDFSP